MTQGWVKKKTHNKQSHNKQFHKKQPHNKQHQHHQQSRLRPRQMLLVVLVILIFRKSKNHPQKVSPTRRKQSEN